MWITNCDHVVKSWFLIWLKLELPCWGSETIFVFSEAIGPMFAEFLNIEGRNT